MKWRGKFVWKTFLVSSNCNLRVWKHTFFTNFCLTEEENFYNRWRRRGRKRECENVTFWSIEGLRFGKKGRKREERKKQLSQKWNYFIFFFFFLSTFILFQCKTVHNFKGYSLQILLRFEKVSYQRYFCSFEKTKSRIFLFSFFFLPPPSPSTRAHPERSNDRRDTWLFFLFFFVTVKKKKKERSVRVIKDIHRNA